MSANSGCFVFCFVADTIYFLSENDLKQQKKIKFFLLLLSYINILSWPQSSKFKKWNLYYYLVW